MMAFSGRGKVYPSKRDWWVTALLWFAVIGMLGASTGLLRSSEALPLRLGVPAFSILVVAFVLSVLYGTNYRLTFQTLIIRSGPFKWMIPLDSIDEVYPTRNPLSSPACSLDRLHVRHRRSRMGVMISPEDKTSFLYDLVSRAPGLEMEGDRVRRG
jgi:hypothetical protein